MDAAQSSAIAHAADLPIGWVVFGFAAQAIFFARVVVQWLASERHRRSVVPALYWWLSLFGGATLCIYFVRRGDPVGTVGQLFGSIIYLRNLWLIGHARRAELGTAMIEQPTPRAQRATVSSANTSRSPEPQPGPGRWRSPPRAAGD